ncbi:MAG: twin-arginine translocase TatA/TatE family subunit [Muribaculaceae bacterium]|nr:twin-arginine translocase TatA/TatE family subunit [Muribaculaceae bacterium]
MTIFNIIPAISMPSGWEWIIILVVVLLLFGGKKIPELMRGLGKGVKSFKQGLNEAKEELNKIDEEEDSTPKGKKD